MTIDPGRRDLLHTFGFGLALGSTLAAGAGRAEAKSAADALLVEAGANDLRLLMARLAKIPRRRDFKSIPMILDDKSQWDQEAIAEVIAYKPVTKQVWDNTELDKPWLNLMRNALNAQVWSFKHPDFLVVSATHGSAHLALYDEATWEKYQLTKLAGDKFKTNTLIEEKSSVASNPKNYEDPKGVFSPVSNSIPVLMRRGVVFMGCHNAIWELAAKLIDKELNPDKLSHEALTAELTNHLIDGVIHTPGAVATIPELQQAGFHYAK